MQAIWHSKRLKDQRFGRIILILLILKNKRVNIGYIGNIINEKAINITCTVLTAQLIILRNICLKSIILALIIMFKIKP